MESGSPCRKPQLNSASQITRSVDSSNKVFSPPLRSFPMLRIKFERAIWQMSASPRRSHEKVVRIGRISRSRRQCFQILENEVHNELPTATPRMEFSARLLLSSTSGY